MFNSAVSLYLETIMVLELEKVNLLFLKQLRQSGKVHSSSSPSASLIPAH